ncbi:MAG: hypothetical protein AB7L09_14945 [Nitrospira sp.]
MSKIPIDLLVHGDSQTLEQLRHDLETKTKGILIEPVTSLEPDELREPILTGLLISLATAALVRKGQVILKILLDHRVKMKELGLKELELKYVYQDDSEAEVKLDRLENDFARRLESKKSKVKRKS